ncbi:P1 family peptidase [Nocardiopsis lucentensis]|uniref:P1 family peptidase n=1 Tax=Nocardiopsis lucentensis TaxID=53441 RepID=UPI00034C6B62|nr:P1 family peptidase [Nocardiopsis lucentensis]
MNTSPEPPPEAPRLTGVPTWGDRPGNADLSPTPGPGRPHGHVDYDFPGVEVGVATYPEGPTGTTVVHVPAGARMAIDARGGAIGLSSGFEYLAHAVCLTGGSVYGLGAGSGVAAELLTRAGNRTSMENLRLVSTAVIYDFSARDNSVVPDARLGREAVRAAGHGSVPVGRVGAGASASAGKVDWSRCEFAGQGAAFRRAGDVRVLVVTVVNPLGVIVDRDGTVVRGNYDTATGTRRHLDSDYATALDAAAVPRAEHGNTTLTVVVTNAALDDRELDHFARQVHGSMHRAIVPFHTEHDGDTLFALTTDEIDLGRGADDVPRSVAVGAIAAEAAWDAVLGSVRPHRTNDPQEQQ